jgi:hypothetical protein
VSARGGRIARSAARTAARLAACFAVAAVTLTGAPPSSAEAVGAHLALDNDQFNFWQKPGARPDFGYTHGTGFALHFSDAPRALVHLVPGWLLGRTGAGESAPALELTFFQGIYAPWSSPPDEPYAGWLEAAIGVSRQHGESVREVLLHAGVTGPPSLAGKVQRYFHRRFDRGEPLPDWSHQLPFEPGLGLEASGAWVSATSGPAAGWRLAAGPLARIRAGGYAVDLRLGMNLSIGLATVPPWPATQEGTGPSLYVRAEPKVDLVARDEFLDGTLFRASSGPGSNPVVFESEFAFGAGFRHARLEWSVVRRGKEFAGQPSLHTYSSCAFTWLP